MPSGSEQRLKLWSIRRRRWSGSLLAATPALVETAIAFWHARDGGARGFRFQDPAEHEVTDEDLLANPSPAIAYGSPTVQLIKTYGPSASIERYQDIYKPTPADVVIEKNATPLTEGVDYTLNDNTGLITLTATNSKSITNITQAGSAVVTVGSSHGFSTNDLVYFSGVVGMTEINGLVGTVTSTAATTITVNIASTSFSAYVSGGTAASYLTTTDTLTWTGTWAWPVRFDQQQQEMSANYPFARDWAFSLIELTS
jgi:uncharacterized protein (TIGR02217 family)